VNLKGVQKLYDRLTPEERFRLAVEAIARGDKAEAERLRRACPWGTRGTHAARLEVSDYLTKAVMLELLPKLAKLRVVEALRPVGECLGDIAANRASTAYLDGFEAGARAAWAQAGRNGSLPELHADEGELAAAAARAAELWATHERNLDLLADDLAADARAPWEAFGRFCREQLGLPPEVLVAAWARPALVNLDDFAAALDAAEPDAAAVETLADVLCCAWRRRALGDETAEIGEDTRAALEADGTSTCAASGETDTA
jgi:hypothetical protein